MFGVKVRREKHRRRVLDEGHLEMVGPQSELATNTIGT